MMLKHWLFFAHGAGADKEHEYIADLVGLLNSQQLNVLRFNFPYMDKRKLDGKRRPPDRMPSLIECYQTVLSNVDSTLPIYIAVNQWEEELRQLLLSDATLMVSNQVKGVICLGYPFHQ